MARVQKQPPYRGALGQGKNGKNNCRQREVIVDVNHSFPEIDGNAVLGHTKILSSDAFEGRGTGTHGEEKTVNYIVEEFKKAGLRPGNTNGTFVQAVPLVGITANSDMTLTFEKEGQRRNLNPKNDFVAWTRRLVDSVELKNSDVVFVGYGVKAPEYDWDDYKAVDVRGKTLIMLVGDPPVPDPADPAKLDPKAFGGKAMTYYGRWTYKYEIGAQRGAAAVIIVHETEPAGYPFSVVQGNVGERFDLIRPDKNLGRVKVEGWIPLERAHELFKMAGQDYDTLKSAAATRAFRPVELGLTASIRINNTIRDLPAQPAASGKRVCPVQRSDPFLWVSWLSKVMAGEKQCEWSCWFRSHYTWNKVPSGLDLAKWTADHTQLLRARRAALEAEGFTVYTEDQNSFTLMGKTGIEVSGKPDIVAIRGEEAYVEDCKTGSPRHFDHFQVLIYMLSLPYVEGPWKGLKLEGRIQPCD
jgi:hypothetical protein